MLPLSSVSNPFQRRLRFRPRDRCLVLVLAALLGFVSVFSVPAISRPLSSSRLETIAQSPSQSPSATALLQQGIERYKAEQFSEAVDRWQQALAAFVAEGDLLNQALALSNLSLAYQQLGRWQEAAAAIADSFSLLQSHPADSPTYFAVQAKALNAQGRLQWFQGASETALESWRQATSAYQQAGDATGAIISLLNQATALQTLGFSTQAEAQLQTVVQIVRQQPDPQLKAIGLQHLGNALRQVGKFNQARAALQESLNTIENANLAADLNSSTRLELGNTELALGNRALAIGQTDQAAAHHASAILFYQQAANLAPSALLRLQAQLNQLSLWVKTGQPAAALDLASTLPSDLASLTPSRTAIYAQLNFAKSLMEIKGQEAASSSLHSPLLTARKLAQPLILAIQQARTLNDTIAESYALGQLGELYEQTEQWQAAQELTQQAWLKAEAAQAPGVRYRWEWQLGRLSVKQGDKAGAVAAYRAAVASLQSIRNDLLRTSSDIQFSFRDDVEPIYRDLVELLLTTTETELSQENLRQAIQQIDTLQLAELENFLRCDLAQIVTVTEESDATAAKLYPMLLSGRLAVVLELPNQPLQYHEVLLSRQEIEQTLQQLRHDLSASDRTPEAITGLQAVYQWLIAPFQPALDDNSQIQTLVFVLDGELRNIPMAALHDGNQYLINQYAVAVAPRLKLFQPSARSADLKVFLGGVGEPQTVADRRFAEITNLAPELNTIEQLVDANPPLLNEAFTQANLEQQLSQENFSAIHLKTHGVFSSDPEETFIVAYQDLITSQELGHLIRTSRLGDASPIELLVLSACSTAQGDDRAVLGLAGIAVQSGTRSAVSTLWEAQDVPNTQLMIRFYRELLNPDITKAQALRLAQLHLIEQGYTTPHIWATYILVGNWL